MIIFSAFKRFIYSLKIMKFLFQEMKRVHGKTKSSKARLSTNSTCLRNGQSFSIESHLAFH